MSKLEVISSQLGAAQFRSFESAEALNCVFADQVAQQLRDAIAERGVASIAVSGGRTPQGFFKALSEHSLDWHNVLITLVDERWVAADDASSNEKLVRDYLLQNRASAAHFIGMYTGAESAEEGAVMANRLQLAMPERLDVAVLGMGEDGHTASFFPGAAQLQHALKDKDARCCFVRPETAPHDRMTLTLGQLLKTRQLYLHLSGEAKLPVLEQALTSDDAAEMPVRAVLHQQQSVPEILWCP